MTKVLAGGYTRPLTSRPPGRAERRGLACLPIGRSGGFCLDWTTGHRRCERTELEQPHEALGRPGDKLRCRSAPASRTAQRVATVDELPQNVSQEKAKA